MQKTGREAKMIDLQLAGMDRPMSMSTDMPLQAASGSSAAAVEGFAALLTTAPAPEDLQNAAATDSDEPSLQASAGGDGMERRELVLNAELTHGGSDDQQTLTGTAPRPDSQWRPEASGSPLPPGGEDLPLPDPWQEAHMATVATATGPAAVPTVPENTRPATGEPLQTAVKLTQENSHGAAATGGPQPGEEASDIRPTTEPLTQESRRFEQAMRSSAEVSLQTTGEPTTVSTSGAGVGATEVSSGARMTLVGGHEQRSTEAPTQPAETREASGGERNPRISLQQTAGQPGWGEEMRSTLQWLNRQGVHRAELQLHPAELGSIDVQITSENDQTSVVFVAANRGARELLEAELPRLRELFSQAGVELSQAEVSTGDREESAQADSDGQFDRGHKIDIKNPAEPVDNPMGAVSSLAANAGDERGLIDYYV